jgi:malate dehydrogenase (oxaloacetate-decarboxylating)
LGGAEVFIEALEAAGAWDWHDPRPLGEQPRQRHLSRRGLLGGGNTSEQVYDGLVRDAGLSGEPRQVGTDVASTELGCRIDAAGQKSPPERAERHETDAQLHLGGKLEVTPTVSLRNRDDLSRAYTPGVARVCLAIAEDKTAARKLTIKRNTVAIVTDGSAMLGLGNIGPEAALPVMEGKAALFKRFADVDAWPVCLDTQDVDEIVRTVQVLSPGYGGVNLEDISAPRCFEVERRLREVLDIPVFHDDQHGTAIVVLAALDNALRLVHMELKDVRIVVSGVGAAGSAIIRLLRAQGASDIVGCDRHGAVEDPGTDNEFRRWIFDNTNPQHRRGTLREVLAGADVFIGVSAPNLLDGDDVATMAEGAIVFALANPDPEVDPTDAARTAAVVATGRSDYPNQINNALAFPGFFRGMLDAGAHVITDECLIAAARAIADAVKPEELQPTFIVPSVFDPQVAPAVAAAVSAAAHR